MGIQFANFQQLKLTCKCIALYDNFEFMVIKADKQLYTIKCSTGDNFPWRLHASLATAETNHSEIIEIKTFVTEHTCLEFTICVINKHHLRLSDPQSKRSFKINCHIIQLMLSMICDVGMGSRSGIELPGMQKKRQCLHCLVHMKLHTVSY